MGGEVNNNSKPSQVPQVQPIQVKPDKPVLFALRRCRYKSNGEIVVAEVGQEIKDPEKGDLDDLIEHGCVESFDQSQVQALLSLRQKDPEAKKRLARAIGII